jgi:hypothetical protein
MVDSPEYQKRQRGNKGGPSTLFWFFIAVCVIVGAIFLGMGSR